MNELKIGNVVFDNSFPKICIPLTGSDRNELRQELQKIENKPCQLIEWRADYMMASMKAASFWEMIRQVIGTLGMLKSMLNKPVLFTIRTSREGGQVDITMEDYIFINKMVADSGMADIIDIEAFAAADSDVVRDFIKYAHGVGSVIMLSSHDFEKTPPVADMVEKYTDMHAMGGDIIKLAVMPDSDENVADLLQAAAVTHEMHPEVPLVAISMGELGASSRVCAGQFGSVITFAAGVEASAPGQIDSEILQKYLELYYK